MKMLFKLYDNDANGDNEDGPRINFDQKNSLQPFDQLSQKQVQKLDKDKPYIF